MGRKNISAIANSNSNGNTPKKSGDTIRLSVLPSVVREQVDKLNLDKDGDGELDASELGLAFGNLADTKKDNVNLKWLVQFLLIFTLLLIGCVFGASIAAARLAKDTTIDVHSGIMYAKGSSSSMKTEDVKIYKDNKNIGTMTNDELDNLKEIIMLDGSLKFQIKGYSRRYEKSANDNIDGEVMLLVEGGTITYDTAGLISDATGDAKVLLDYAFPPSETNTNTTSNRHRYLASSSSTGVTTAVGGANNGNRGS